MSLEKENTKKRKKAPLTNSEAASFFFLPINLFKSRLTKSLHFNEEELLRFEKYGFEKKLKQAKDLTLYGQIFYTALIIILTYLLK